MAIYAVKSGTKTGKFNTWQECCKYVIGVSGADYRRFSNEADADAYLGIVKKANFTGLTKIASQQLAEPASFTGLTMIASQQILNQQSKRVDITNWVDPEDLPNKEAVAYVDGSCDTQGRFSFGCVYVSRSTGVLEFSGCDDNERFASSKNVTGELIAALYALRIAFKGGASQLTIVHDYRGTASLAQHTMTARAEVTKAYQRYMERLMKHMPVYFKWVKSHSGKIGNNRADRLATTALSECRKFSTDKFLTGYL